MFITTTSSSPAAPGFSAIAAGLLFIVTPARPPPRDPRRLVTTTDWMIVALLTMTMSIPPAGRGLHFFVPASGDGAQDSPGLVGFRCLILLSSSRSPVTFIEVFVLPRLADQQLYTVEDFLVLAPGGEVVGDSKPLPAGQSGVVPVGYLLGGFMLFGVVLYRTKPPRALGLLAARRRFRRPRSSSPSSPTPSTGSSAFPVGLALAGLGYSLWREQDAAHHSSPPRIHPRRARDPAGVEVTAARRRRGTADSAAASGLDLAAARGAGRAQPDPGAGRVPSDSPGSSRADREPLPPPP